MSQNKNKSTNMNTIANTKNVGLKCGRKPNKNYQELKAYIPDNDCEENYALLTHYLMMKDDTAKAKKKAGTH